ncbi:hypothetical protein DKT68_13495 [Micromonospora acroterricola]|uniref:Uncharacterized protein n=1 Tax=Micromonospora acroterricola TaxID=2202421 RepID=A0A317D2Q8_9ACTN|nr:hypothetical protein DKT68_13495 [Micromonospora acroterricola]
MPKRCCHLPGRCVEVGDASASTATSAGDLRIIDGDVIDERPFGVPVADVEHGGECQLRWQR